MSTVLHTDEEIARLRKALRSGDGAAIDHAAAPLIRALWEPLVDQARRLIRSAWRPLGLEGEDLVQDAWIRALTYLIEPGGEAVRTQEHLLRLLLRMIKQRFFDTLDRAEGRDEQDFEDGKAEQVSGAAELGEGLLWLEAGARQKLIGALFAGDDAFRAACVGKPKRRARQYQSYVLFTLAEFYRREVLSDGAAAGLFERYVSLLGVAPEDWGRVEQVAAQPEAGDAELFAVVNTLCGTALAERKALYVLRHELGELAS